MTTTLFDEINSLNEQQKKAALHTRGPLLVLAGAGSGKTKVATLRIAQLIEQGVSPYSILGVTFTNKAANEMKERVLKYSAKEVLVSTFHSLGVKILRESITFLGYSPQFAIYDEDDTDKLLRACAKDALGDKVKIDIKDLRAFISTFKNALLSPEAAERHERGAFQEQANIYAQYQKKLKEYNAVDFDDLLYLPVRIFREFDEVLQRYEARWQYILVDEYQDTNKAQYELVKLLSRNHQNVFAVGDPDQSIYSWRGANISNILNFERDYPEATIIRLEENYRSTNIILRAANAVIENNAQRYEKSLFSKRGIGEPIKIYEGFSEKNEAEFVAKTIETYHDYKNIPYNDIVIFYRTNFQSRAFEDALIARYIPYTIVGGLSFYQRKEIKDILAHLKLLENPNDVVSFMRIANLPKRGLGEKALSKFVEKAQEHEMPILDFLLAFQEKGISFPTKQTQGLLDFAEAMRCLKNVKDQNNLPDLVRACIFETKYLQVLDEDKETKEERRENLDELIVKTEEWNETHETKTLAQFLEEILLASSKEKETDGPRVSLMTLHTGKGLEFPLVFIVGLEEDLFPHINSKKGENELEEERRLFYVGMTRAKEHLFFTHVFLRSLWGTKRPMNKSRFLAEVPQELCEKVRG